MPVLPPAPAVDRGLEAELLRSVAEARDDLVALTQTLVSFPSLLGQEQAAQDFLEGWFRGQGLQVDRFPVNDAAIRHLPGYSPCVGHWAGHDNLVAIHPAAAPGKRSLILNGHIDVVPTGPTELWTTAPFEPRVAQGRLYGRGAGDMKAGIAASLIAFRAFSALGLQPAGAVFLQSVVEEECTGNGALACLQRGYRADAAIIPEPFGRRILEAQVGVLWLTVDVTGRPAHVLDTASGVNAIEAAFALYQGLRPLEAEWNRLARALPAFADHAHPINFNLGCIQGGEWPSSVPTRCRMELRFGIPPGMSPAQARSQVEAALESTRAAVAGLDPGGLRLINRGLAAQGFVADRGEPLLQALAASHEAVLGEPAQWLASTATTDARILRLYGDTPAACYGPEAGHIHGIDEWVDLNSTVEVAQVLAVFLARWCGVAPRS